MLKLIVQAFYFCLPIYFANMAPVLTRKKGKKYKPLDFGMMLWGKRVLGENKTIRGFLMGVLFGVITAFVQYLFQSYGIFEAARMLDYGQWLLIGVLMGAGAMIGDSLKSFVKRQLGYKPGERFVPFDQTDFVIGGIAMMLIIEDLSLKFVAVAIALTFVLHIAVNHTGYYLKIRDEKW